MSRNANGTYTLPPNNPVAPNTVITVDWANPTMSDLATEITNSLSRNGNGGMLAPLKHTDGSAAAPSSTFTADPQSGMYLSAAGDIRFSLIGTDVMRINAGTVQLWDSTNSIWYNLLSAQTAGASAETQTITGGATVIPFTKYIAGASIYLNGAGVDQGRLLITDDYTYNATTNEVTLLTVYPDGTKITALVNDESEVVQAAEIATIAAAEALDSETAAAASEDAAALSETNAGNSETAAGISETNAAASETAAGLSETAAGISESSAAASAVAAGSSASNAASSETAAGISETNAAASETAAGISETNAAASETSAEAWAESPTPPGGAGTRSSKTWAGVAGDIVGAALQISGGQRNIVLNQDPTSVQSGAILNILEDTQINFASGFDATGGESNLIEVVGAGETATVTGFTSTTVYCYADDGVTFGFTDVAPEEYGTQADVPVTPLGDYYVVQDGVMYNSAGAPIQRVYLAQCGVDGVGDFLPLTLVQFPVGKSKLLGVEIHGPATAPTPATSDNSTKISTTAFVKNNLSSVPANTSLDAESGWWRCGDTGIVFQWAKVLVDNPTTQQFTFPIAFPSVAYNLQAAWIDAQVDTAAFGPGVQILSRTQYTVDRYSGYATTSAYIFATGR